MAKKVAITAYITAVPGQAEPLKAAIIELIDQTLKEPGCKTFKVFQSDEDPEQFILWEVFTNRSALQEHMIKDYTQKYFSLGLTLTTTVIEHSELSKSTNNNIVEKQL